MHIVRGIIKYIIFLFLFWTVESICFTKQKMAKLYSDNVRFFWPSVDLQMLWFHFMKTDMI